MKKLVIITISLLLISINGANATVIDNLIAKKTKLTKEVRICAKEFKKLNIDDKFDCLTKSNDLLTTNLLLLDARVLDLENSINVR